MKIIIISSGVTIGRARRAVHAGPALWGGAQNLPDAVFLKVMLALYITINLEIRSLDYENCNCSASNEQFQSAHSSLLLTERKQNTFKRTSGIRSSLQ